MKKNERRSYKMIPSTFLQRNYFHFFNPCTHFLLLIISWFRKKSGLKKNTISNVWTVAHYWCYISKMIVTLEAFMVWKHTIKGKVQSQPRHELKFFQAKIFYTCGWGEQKFIENFLHKSILSYPITSLKTSRQQHFTGAHKSHSQKEEIPVFAFA